jgi:maleate cis-trans isomerase
VSFELNRKVLLRIVYEEAKEAFVSAGRPDGGWLPGQQRRTSASSKPWEIDLGIPVVSSQQAMMWASARAAMVSEKAVACGGLFNL